MEWSGSVQDKKRITDIRHYIQDNECIMTWKWPEGISYVYVHGHHMDAETPRGRPLDEEMRLYTREEYKARQGYRVKLEGIGRLAFRIYAAERENGVMVVNRQEDSDNLLVFSSGKAKIRYSIKYGIALFRKRKPVSISLHSEVFVSREALCYVKKEGTVPASNEDGVVYPFIHDLNPGRNTLPDIEIGKQDYIRLFFTDRRKYGELYELIPE